MDSLRQYIITVIAATIMSKIVLDITEKKGATHSVLKFITGIFIIITVISPFKQHTTYDISGYFSDWGVSASEYVQAGEESAKSSKNTFIKEQTQAYILDRADQLGIDVTVEVVLNEDDLSIPKEVYINGSVSPYGKLKLQQIISQELGITEDKQIWS